MLGVSSFWPSIRTLTIFAIEALHAAAVSAVSQGLQPRTKDMFPQHVQPVLAPLHHPRVDIITAPLLDRRLLLVFFCWIRWRLWRRAGLDVNQHIRNGFQIRLVFLPDANFFDVLLAELSPVLNEEVACCQGIGRTYFRQQR
jgi:hypothetical protein